MVDKKILDLLTKIGCVWQPQFSDVQLKTISIFWQRKLARYTDAIINESLEQLSGVFHRKPMLADFVEKCKEISTRLSPVGVRVFKYDFIAKHQYQSWLTKIYGSEATNHVELSYAEYDRAKKNGTIEKYRDSVLARMHGLSYEKFKFYEVVKKN